MAQPDVFALHNSGLDTFLFAELGDELNGSGLTVLSMLARLGHDPWSEAANLVNLPKTAAIDSLARRIGRMPLRPKAIAEAHETATRLVGLLPVNNPAKVPAAGGVSQGARDVPILSGLPKWLPMTLLYCALALSMGASMIAGQRPEAPPTPPAHQHMPPATGG